MSNGATVEDVLIGVKTVAKMLGVCTAHVRRMSKAGRMPKELRIGNRTSRWSREAIKQWVADGAPDLREGEAQ